MSNYKTYIIGSLLLIGGIAIGWLGKPGMSATQTVDHSGHDMSTMSSGAEAQSSAAKEEIWTCSMHPQIRQNEPGICPICEMDLIPLDNSLSNDDPAVLMMSEASAKLAQIETTVVGGGNNNADKSSSILVEGTVEIDERSINAQSAHIGGRIESLNVNFEGEYVKAGQKIATIYSTGLLAASEELLTAVKFEDKVEGIKDASIQKLRNWKISEAQIESILSSGKPIETIDLFADHSGYVLKKKVSLGDYVNQGQALYTVGQTNRLWLIFNVFESDLANVKTGQQVIFTTPSTGTKKFNARINYIEPLLDPTSRTATVRAETSSNGKQLKPGMLLKGSIISTNSKSTKGAISVPRTAVLWTGNTSVVYVKQQDTEVPSYQFREVTIGSRSGNFVQILSGVQEGDELVTHGAFAIDAAAQLNNNFSMMNRNVSIKKEVQSDMTPDYTTDTPDEFKTQLNTVANAYLDLKDAFVRTDADAAAEKAQQIISSLEGVDMTLILGESHMYWMEQLPAMKSHADNINESTDIEAQRKQFESLSDAIIKAIEAFGTIGNTYYIQHCPMANNNQGADWISAQEQIQNPYFGDKMMKCGSVKRLIQ
ncbi:MAG: Cu(I)/Ag(I) efflux system membrane fusion protein [Saprospiraceae bacterium]|jgi:Cu(I)/Ag(I) efflux system membrane fusion protein